MKDLYNNERSLCCFVGNMFLLISYYIGQNDVSENAISQCSHMYKKPETINDFIREEEELYKKWTFIDVQNKSFQFHSENIKLVVDAKYELSRNNNSNVAAVGFTIKNKEKVCSEILFLLHSGLIKTN